MPGQQYRIREATLGIGLDEISKRVVVSIPKGAEITVVEDEVDRAPWVKVSWNGRVLEMFLIDLRNRGELFRAAGNG
jgi:hypothetical protein